MTRLLLYGLCVLFLSCETEPLSQVKSSFPNGQAKRVQLFEVQDSGDSVLIGLEQYYIDGTLEMRGSVSKGERIGQWLYYYPSGGLWSECDYLEGLRHGKSATYFSNIMLRYSGQYALDSMLRSTFIYYDSLGNELSATNITQP